MGNTCKPEQRLCFDGSRGGGQVPRDSGAQTIGAATAVSSEHVSLEVTELEEDVGELGAQHGESEARAPKTAGYLVAAGPRAEDPRAELPVSRAAGANQKGQRSEGGDPLQSLGRRGKAERPGPGHPAGGPGSQSGLRGASGILSSCCSVGRHCPTLAAHAGGDLPDAMAAAEPDEEEELDHLPDANGQRAVGLRSHAGDRDSAALLAEIGKSVAHGQDHGAHTDGHPSRGQGGSVRWDVVQKVGFGVFVVLIVFISSFAKGWLSPRPGDDGEVSGESVLRYGSIPIIAAIIGYVTNVVALEMMFYPIDFVGFFPHLKIGCGLDLPLFGWQGVIPMRAEQMATISVKLMTQKLIQVNEIFDRLDPSRVAQEVDELLAEIVPAVVNGAGRKHLPKLWEHLPTSLRRQLEERFVADAKPMMSHFIADLQKNIGEVFDLTHCVVDALVKEPQILNNMFLACGAAEFKFIRISGFYLGFMFGILQMVVWMFVKQWWILPLCGVFVGYFTNVIALKVIFLPVEPKPVFGGRVTVQGLFLKRQVEVSALYSRETAERILCAPVLMRSLVHGPLSESLFALVDKHVVDCMERQAAPYKPAILLAVGADNWVAFRRGVCVEFREKLPAMLMRIEGYMQEAMELETTLRTRLEALPFKDFERLLHEVFEQDEIKLILVGALLGALVGFLQALAQTPGQLGL